MRPGIQAATIGMRKRMAVSTRACGICSGELRDFGTVVSASEEAGARQNGLGPAGQAKPWGAESTVQLECKHCFHDQCIRGWTIVGKKVRSLCAFYYSCCGNLQTAKAKGLDICSHSMPIQAASPDLYIQRPCQAHSISSSFQGCNVTQRVCHLSALCRTHALCAWRRWILEGYLQGGPGRPGT